MAKPKGPRPASTYRGYRRNHKIGDAHRWQTTPNFLRQELTSWNRPVKSLAQKGAPRAIARHITVRINPQGKPQEFHATKGWRRMV